MDVHLRRLRARFQINAEEERVVRGLVAGETNRAADTTIIRAMEDQVESRILLEGWPRATKVSGRVVGR
jgi:hypothetical protein